MDTTFNQNIAPFGNADSTYYSFDLSAATDRIPIEIYWVMLAHWKGKEYADAWKRTMVGIEFRWKDDYVKYATGQPMGLYSSWALLATAHHLIVQYSAIKVGITDFKDYRILGDDIVIRNDAVAASYRAVMTEFGIGISPEKTLVSKDTFEFAKR